MTEATHDDLKARLERAEDILRTLEHGEADAVLGRDGPSLVRSMNVIGREGQVKLALEELAKARAIELEMASSLSDLPPEICENLPHQIWRTRSWLFTR